MTGPRFLVRVHAPGESSSVTHANDLSTVDGVTAWYLREYAGADGAHVVAMGMGMRRAHVRHGGRWLPVVGGVS